jgi:hypothetical protein
MVVQKLPSLDANGSHRDYITYLLKSTQSDLMQRSINNDKNGTRLPEVCVRRRFQPRSRRSESRALSRGDQRPKRDTVIRGLLTPTFVIANGIVTRCCLNEGFCSVLCYIKSKHSYLLGLYLSTSINNHHINPKKQKQPTKKPSKVKDICKLLASQPIYPRPSCCPTQPQLRSQAQHLAPRWQYRASTCHL